MAVTDGQSPLDDLSPLDVPSGKLKPGPGMEASRVAAHQRARIQRAMIEIVADHGYGAVKVRQLVLLAGVSSRAFYENFSSKEDCFLRTYEMVSRRATRRVMAAQAGERDWRARPRLVFAEFAHELKVDPKAARFALLEAHAAGPEALEQVRRAEGTFTVMLGESFARAPGGIGVPHLIVEGMAGGIAAAACTRLSVGREGELPGIGDEIVEWVLGYPGKSANQLARLDEQTVWRNTMLEPLVPMGSTEEETWASKGDRALILSAATKLAVEGGYAQLTRTRIRSAAKVSRKIFDSYFDTVEACYIAAAERRLAECMTQVARAQTAGRTWAGGLYRGVVALCEQIAEDPILIRLCLADDFATESAGTLSRTRMLKLIAEQFGDSAPVKLQPTELVSEVSNGAIWALFHHHIIRDAALRRQLAASLSFISLTPIIGAELAVASIRREQNA